MFNPSPLPLVSNLAPASVDWEELANRFALQCFNERREELARDLGLPRQAIDCLPMLGWRQDAWTIPEMDGFGKIVGIQLRRTDGSRCMIPGSQRGLIQPAPSPEPKGPIFVVEGMSDALTLAQCGLAAVARPSASGGLDYLVQYFQGIDASRPIFIFGVNDAKADGTWPGRDGCEAIRDGLKRQLPDRTILGSMLPEKFKDVRDWVLDRVRVPQNASAVHEIDWPGLGKDLSDWATRVATRPRVPSPPMRPGARFPIPLPINLLKRGGNGGNSWLWDGYLARGSVTLFSALPKCGKTTLITHLLKALHTGGNFLGRSLLPGRAVVISEESQLVWAERAERLGLQDSISVLSRPFFSRPSPEDWVAFMVHMKEYLEGNPADLLVLDTLADLWPVRDENSAIDVQAALKPLRHLSEGRSVLCVHHLRKKDGSEGTGSRGSGALAGFVDILMELRRAKSSIDPHQTKRTISAFGRYPGIPHEWVIELDPATENYHFADKTEKQVRSSSEELTETILDLLAENPGMTWKELWQDLPTELRKNQIRFRDLLNQEESKFWRKEQLPGQGGPIGYFKL